MVRPSKGLSCSGTVNLHHDAGVSYWLIAPSLRGYIWEILFMTSQRP